MESSVYRNPANGGSVKATGTRGKRKLETGGIDIYKYLHVLYLGVWDRRLYEAPKSRQI